jgi:hypothetical protein
MAGSCLLFVPSLLLQATLSSFPVDRRWNIYGNLYSRLIREKQERNHMKHLGCVSSEGGPLLLTDAVAAENWKGIDDAGQDYARACQIFDDAVPGGLLAIGEEQALVWDMEDAGTSDVFANEGGFIVLRSWLGGTEEFDIVVSLAEMAVNRPVHFATIEISTDRLAILWSANSGRSIVIEEADITEFEEGTGLLVKTEPGRFDAFHDSVEFDDSSAIRCHLVRK